MSACEKCWREAGRRVMSDTSKTQTDHYGDIIKEKEGNPCSPQEQSGEEIEAQSHAVFNETQGYMRIFDQFISDITGQRRKI